LQELSLDQSASIVSKIERGLNLKVSVTKGEGWKRTLEVEVPPDLIEQEFERAFVKIQKEAKLPGFRPGKVPLDLIKTRFKEAAQEEVIESLLNSSYRQALEETKLQPLTFPRVKDVKFEPGISLSYQAEIEIQPEIEVKDYKKLKLVRQVQPVEDKEVDNAVQFLRERNAELRPVEREIREKDFVVVDLEEFFRQNGKPANQRYENQLLEIDPELMLKQFQEALVGAKIGEDKNFSVEYPAEHANKRLAGQKVGYRVKIKEVKEKILPFLDDNFAKAQGDYQTLLELRLKIRESLEKRHFEDSQKEVESQAISKIVEKNNFPVPESLMNSYLNYLTEEMKKRYPETDEKEIREKNRKGAEKRIRWEYIFHQLAEKESITVTEQDVENRVKAFGSAYNLAPDKAKEYLTQTKQMEKMKESILEEKVLEKVLSFSEIKEERKDK